MAAAGAVIATVTLAAAWIINTALATNPNLNARVPNGPAAIALAGPYPVLAGAADVTGSIHVATYRASADPASADPVASDPADTLTFEAKWAGAMASAAAPAETAPVAAAPAPQQPIEAASKVASLPPARETAVTPDKRATPPQAHNKSMLLPDPDSRIAVYDIAAHTVYLPNGNKLEAHSGLGDKLDDPRYVSMKDRGPTPPNVYDLALRESLFHDVRAIRLNPVGSDHMFGRDGILAHSYMLGANGQSNGCVSFKDYPAFLHAYLRGEVDRLVVVAHLGDTSWRTASDRRGVRRYADNIP